MGFSFFLKTSLILFLNIIAYLSLKTEQEIIIFESRTAYFVSPTGKISRGIFILFLKTGLKSCGNVSIDPNLVFSQLLN